MRTVRLLEEAAQEAIEAAAWYERQRPGLGREFERALNTAFDLLEDDIVPLTNYLVQRPVKKLLLKRFPYNIVVQEFPEEVLVVAVAHQSRRPGFWKGRLTT